MRSTLVGCLSFSLILLGSTSASAADELGPLLKKTLAAYGGQKALTQARVVRQTGKVASTMRAGAEGALVRIFERPQRLRVEIGYPKETPEVRVLDGARGLRNGSEVKGPPYDAMVLQAARLGLPLLLWEKKAQLRDGGPVQRDGHTLRSVEVPLEGGLALTVQIDPATGHILHTSGKAEGPPGFGGSIEFGSSYADFKKVGGVLFAFKETTYAMGRHTGDTTLEKIELLPKAPLDAFGP